jgi:hypothetical protein
MRSRSSPPKQRARYGRKPRSVQIATQCVVVSVTCVESMAFRGRARRRRRPRRAQIWRVQHGRAVRAAHSRERGFGRTLVEAPTLVAAGGSYYLFYSANWWESANYAIGYALCTAPNGSCSKPRNSPIMASGSQRSGPGGEDVFIDGTGQLWMAYAAWAPMRSGISR